MCPLSPSVVLSPNSQYEKERSSLLKESQDPQRGLWLEFRGSINLEWKQLCIFLFMNLSLKSSARFSYECRPWSTYDVTKRNHLLSHHFTDILKCHRYSSLLWDEGRFENFHLILSSHMLVKKHIYDSISDFLFIILITVFQPNWFPFISSYILFYFFPCKHYSEKTKSFTSLAEGSGSGRGPSSVAWFCLRSSSVHPPSHIQVMVKDVTNPVFLTLPTPQSFSESCRGSWFFINELTGSWRTFFFSRKWRAGDLCWSLTAQMCEEIEQLSGSVFWFL